MYFKFMEIFLLSGLFFRITDLGNIKRRLYLSTVHKELSSTPLHAKIPLFMIKRKIVSITCTLPKIGLNLIPNTFILGLLCIEGLLLGTVILLKVIKKHAFPPCPLTSAR